MKSLIVILQAALIILIGSGQIQAQPVGEAFTVGETYRYWQGRISTGKMIVREYPETHFVWTGRNEQMSQIYWNAFIERQGIQNPSLLSGELGIYPNICQKPDDHPWVFFSGIDSNQFPDNIVGCACYLSDNGFQFHSTNFTSTDTTDVFWFTGSMNSSQTIFSAASGYNIEYNYYPLITWRAMPVDYPDEYSIDEPQTADSSFLSSYIVASSDESDAAALVWHHYRPGFPPVEWWNGYIYNCMENDIYVVESRDGSEWSFDVPVNITRTIDPDPEAGFPFNCGDTLRPFPDLDAIYVGDVLHVVFTTCGFVLDVEGEEFYPRITAEESFIWHWDSESDTLTLVADGWFASSSRSGSWASNVCQPSLGADPEGNLFCVFRQAIEDDHAVGYEVHPPYCFSDIMVTRSTDGGASWSEALNITETRLGDGDIGDPVNEVYPSLAENVDDFLHIQYLQYGATPEDPQLEGMEIISPIIYQRVPVEELAGLDPLPMPREGFTYHIQSPTAVSGNDLVPQTFGIADIYPNPFNQSTRISFNIERTGRISLELFNLQGQRLEVILSDNFPAGSNSIVWNAADIAGGVYIIRLNGLETTDFRKKILLK